MANNQQQGGSGTFANDPRRASEAGRKGGQQSHQQGQSGADTRQQGGGNFGQNPERAARAGRSGGQHVPDDKRSFSQDRDLAAQAGRKGGRS